MLGTNAVRYEADGVQVRKNVLIPMSDGVRLAADLYAPLDFSFEEGHPQVLPVVVEYIPYRKDDVAPHIDWRWYKPLPQSGYVVARVDCRGTGGSEGRAYDEYSEQEQRDGYALVEWIGSQSWCNGRVAMIGLSYGGFTAVQVAALAPPHLAAIVPIYFTDDRYADDSHYVGNLLRMYYDAGFYGPFMVAFNAMPPDPKSAETSWAEIWEDHLAHNEPYILNWLRHQQPGEYWKCGSVGPIADCIRCPVFMIGGWHDGYVNPPFRLYQKLTGEKKLLVGPWDHSLPDVAIPGPRIDYMREVVTWLDRWCTNVPSPLPAAPPIVVYMESYSPPDADMQEARGAWRAEWEWPPLGGKELVSYLDDGGFTGAPTKSAVDLLAYEASVGVCTGLFSGGLPFGLPSDHRRDEAFSLNYTSEAITEDLHILGRPRVVVFVESDAAVFAISATLCEVGSDGSSRMVSKGIVRAESFEHQSDKFNGSPAEVEVELNSVGWRFTRGNRIRLSIANSDFPNVWPTPEPAMCRVHRGLAAPSRLIMPVVPSDGSAVSPAFKPSIKAVTPASRSAYRVWEVTENVLEGTMRVSCHFTHFAGSHPSELVACVNRSRPSEASMSGVFKMDKVVGGRSVSAVSSTMISSTSSCFHVTVTLSVQLDGLPFFTRHWTDSIPRDA